MTNYRQLQLLLKPYKEEWLTEVSLSSPEGLLQQEWGRIKERRYVVSEQNEKNTRLKALGQNGQYCLISNELFQVMQNHGQIINE